MAVSKKKRVQGRKHPASGRCPFLYRHRHLPANGSGEKGGGCRFEARQLGSKGEPINAGGQVRWLLALRLRACTGARGRGGGLASPTESRKPLHVFSAG